MRVQPIKLKWSNAYLVIDDAPILVDSGSPGEEAKLLAAVAAAGISFGDVRLIVHTHVHGDHVGSTAALQASFPNALLAYHRLDEPLMQQGNNGRLRGIGLRGRVMSRFMSDGAFPTFAPDFYLEEGQSLAEFGVNGTVLLTPGHTPGSISLLLANGAALIGDVLMGGYLGGNIAPRRPNYHYFAVSLADTLQSLEQILAVSTSKLYVGHGGPLAVPNVRRWLTRQEESRDDPDASAGVAGEG